MEHNQGYGKAYAKGLLAAIRMGADIIVNTDGDNQYCGADVTNLITPILNKQADIVIGERPLMKNKQWSLLKKCLQKLGTFVVRILSSEDIKDATCGFRAYTKEAALSLNLFENFSPSQETIIQTKAKKLIIKSVPIRVNADLRKSILMSSIFQFIKNKA